MTHGVFALALVVMFQTREAVSNSLGLNIPLCDAYNADIWKPKPAGRAMWWTKAPIHSEDFSVRSGDTKRRSADPKSYTPGALSYIHVRSLVRDQKYRGFLLYATNTKGDKIGSWELPPEKKIDFHTPPGAKPGCEGKAVMHSGADKKPYHSVFAFRAPPAGAGKLTFHALLKLGPANTGYFVWPNKRPLVLQEGGAAPPQQWFKGAPGLSCSQVCSRLKGSCNEGKLSAISSASSFQAALSSQFVCKLPLLDSCGRKSSAAAAPDQDSADGYCAYSGTTCKPQCGTPFKAGSRFCPCDNTGSSAEALASAVTRLGDDESWEEDMDTPLPSEVQNNLDEEDAKVLRPSSMPRDEDWKEVAQPKVGKDCEKCPFKGLASAVGIDAGAYLH